MNKYYLIMMVLAFLYTFGIGWFFGTFSGYVICKEKGKINDWDSPAEFICGLLFMPVVSIVCSVTLFFNGIKGLEKMKEK